MVTNSIFVMLALREMFRGKPAAPIMDEEVETLATN